MVASLSLEIRVYGFAVGLALVVGWLVASKL
jgi:prolipoprotein diacylglyceryltransferase